MWRRLLAFTLCVSLSVGGCAPIVSWRTDLAHHYQAHQAWKAQKGGITRRGCGEKDFACGWKQGYFDAACGSNGAPPPVPPECYWKPFFQTPEGRKQVDAWYEGYHYGVIAADQQNAGELARIPTAPGLGSPPAPWLTLPPTVDVPMEVPGQEPLPAPPLQAAARNPRRLSSKLSKRRRPRPRRVW